jgi:hypothetical protein
VTGVQTCALPIFLFDGHSSDSGWSKISWGGETSENYLVQGGDHMGHPQKSPTWTVTMPTLFIMHNSPVFFDQSPPLPNTTFIYCTFTTHFINILQMTARWSLLVFNIIITDPTSQVAGFEIFASIFIYSIWGKKNYDRTKCNTSFLPDKQTFTESACHLHGHYSWLVLTFWMCLVIRICWHP